MPQTDFREKTGRFNNKVNGEEKYGPEATQKKLDAMANSVGQQPTREGLFSPSGVLYLLSILSNLQLPQEGGPKRQVAVQETAAAFEADTMVRTRNEAGQARIDSFQSSSTVNTTRIRQSMPLNQIEQSGVEQADQSSGSSTTAYTLADEVHRWSLELHKLAYGIKELLECMTEKETFRWGETFESSHFHTICQTAIGKSSQLNRPQAEESTDLRQFSFKHSDENVSDEQTRSTGSFTSEEAAKKLRMTFQSYFEKHHEKKESPSDEAKTQENAFWEELTSTFSNFFRQFDNQLYAEHQAGFSGHSVIDHFLTMMKKNFLVNDEEEKAQPIQRNEKEQMETKSEKSAVHQIDEILLQAEEITFSTKLGQLTSELAATLDHFAQRIQLFPILGAEAKPLPKPSTLTEATSIDEQADRTVSPTIDPETNQVQEINATLVNNRISSNRYQEPLPIFFYNHDLFQRRNGTSNVNKKLKEFFIKEKMANDTTPDLELPNIAQQWIGNKELDKLERKQFLTYLILNHYGVENVRWGEFVSASQSQNIFRQWQANTLLEDYTYKEMTDETVQHDLSEPENIWITSFNQYKKESDQLYKEFISELPGTISQDQLLSPIYYDDALFKKPEIATVEANEAVRKFLVEEDAGIDIQTPGNLVRKLQEWILAGENYADIIDRQLHAAELVCTEYGAVVEDMSPIQARLLLLQWENNNAQAGYHFKEFPGHERTEQNQDAAIEPVEESEITQKIADFIRENEIEVSQSDKKMLPELDEEQKESQRRNIASLLTEHGMPCVYHEPKQLTQAVVQWLFLGIDDSESASSVALNGTASGSSKSPEFEEPTSEALYAFKIKQLANVLLENKEEGISAERANELVGQWLTDTTEEVPPQEFRIKKRSIPSKVATAWQKPKLMRKVEQFLRKQSLLPPGRSTNETVLLAAGKWLMPDENNHVFHKENLQSFAEVIAKDLNLYGGKGEKLSDPVAEMMVRKWVFENILGESFEEYLAKKIIVAPDPTAVTIHDLRLHLDNSVREFYRVFLPNDYKGEVKKKLDNFAFLWHTLIETSLSVDYDFLLKKESIAYSGLLPQLIGGKLASLIGDPDDMNESQKRSLGVAFMDRIAEKNDLSFVDLQVIFLPALLVTAQLEPDALREAFAKGTYKEVALSTFINYCRTGYFNLVEEQKTMDTLVQSYQTAMLDWRSKKAIAGEVIQECYAAGAKLVGETPLHPWGESPFKKTTREEAIDYYLSGENPCPTLKRPLPVLEKRYQTLTHKVADAYFPLDKKLIEKALDMMDRAEFQFLFSKETQIYEASASIRKETATTQGWPTWKNVPLKDTELFLAKQDEEERMYGLKKLGREQGYVVYRVDKDPTLYNKYGFFSETCVPIRDKLQFSVNNDKERFGGIHGQGHSAQTLFTWRLGWTHRDKLYDRLYKEGDEKTKREKEQELLLSFVPFYDCITGGIEKDASKAAVACTFDILSLLPVIGEAVAVSTKFGLGVARAFLRGGLKNVLRSSGQLVPKTADLARIGVSILRYLDPGIELVHDTSQLLTKLTKLNFKTRTKEVDHLIDMVEKLQKETAVASEPFLKARLPKGGPEVPVKRVDDQLYVRVTNPNTGDAFGEYFLLKNNQLEIFKGPVKFSEIQEEMIQNAAVKLKENQQFVDEMNLNPSSYGDGIVRAVSEEGQANQLFIKMKDQWIPVKETTIAEHGVRYDACLSGKLFPVNYNGREWYFEAETSPFLTKKVSNRIGKKLNKFETLADPSVLSAPDARGLMKDASGRTYIKIKNHYVPLILLDERAGRYHLVKKNANSPMMILRFHPEFNQFHVETVLERKIWEAELKLEYDKFEANYHRTGESQPGGSQPGGSQPGGSQPGESQPGGSQPGGSQPGESQPGGSQPGGSQQVALPQLDLSTHFSSIQEIDKLPIGPDRSCIWNAVRQVSVLPPSNQLPLLSQTMIERVLVPMDLTVQPQRLTNFIPNRPNEVLDSSLENEIHLRTSIMKNNLNPYFTSLPNQPKLDFQVIKGVDTSNSPDFLKDFQVDLKKGIEKGRRAFSYLKDRCQQLASVSDISATKEGQYLTQMFTIEHAIDKNQILKEINQRLLLIAERGERILQTTIDTGFENIWIASTDLVLNQNTGRYETQLVKKREVYSFVIPTDPQARMVFLADTFHLPPDPVIESKRDLFKVILHESTHLGARTDDLVLSPVLRKGYEISGKELLYWYHKNFPQIVKSPAFHNFVDRLAEQQNLPNLSPQAVEGALIFDDMLRVNFQMEDAEMIAVITRDLAEGRSFDFKKRVTRNLDEQPLADQLATIFKNYALSSLFNLDQYHLSPHLNRTQEQENIKNSADPHEKMEAEKEKDKSTANVKREVEKRSILKAIATGIEKSNARRSVNRKSSKIGELAIN